MRSKKKTNIDFLFYVMCSCGKTNIKLIESIVMTYDKLKISQTNMEIMMEL